MFMWTDRPCMTIANDWDVNKHQTNQIKLRLYWLEYKLYHSANNSVLRTITETLTEKLQGGAAIEK